MNATSERTPLRVLIVEDEQDDADLVVHELRRGGFPASSRRVMTAAQLRAALAESEWDVVLADYRLPQFSAPAALHELQQSGQDVPFIVVSGTVGEEAAVEVLRAGAHDFLVKGKLARLVPAVRRELHEARQRAERRQIERLLHVTEERLRMLVNGVHDHAMITLDANGCIATWNPAAELIFGYPADEIVGHAFARLYTREDNEHSWPRRLLESADASGRVEAEGWRARRDGSRFWADGVVTALRDADGQLVGYSDVTRDCTVRRLVEQERADSLSRERAARADAEAALRTRDEFLSIASHELRTPVAGVKAAAQLLLRWQRRGTLDSDRLERSLQDLERSASRLAQLTEDLLDVGRLKDGRLPLRPASVDLSEMLARVVHGYKPHITEAHYLALDVPVANCPVMADPDRIEQVVLNLLQNAVKYSPNGGPIQLQLRAQRGGYLIRVRDRGIGLPQGAGALIFEPFGRASNSTARQLPGMGLGLYICRQIAEAHGGYIQAESPGENEGTTMSLWLPRALTGDVRGCVVTCDSRESDRE